MIQEDRSADAGAFEADIFDATYLRLHDRTVRLAWLLTGDGEAAREVAHDAWANTYRRHRRRPVDDLGPYVMRAVVNRANSLRRRGVLERAYLRTVGRDGVVADGGVLDGAPAEVDRRMALADCLQRLPRRMRTAVVLRYYLDLSVADTAGLMGVSQGTVKSSVSRGLGPVEGPVGGG